MANSVDPVETAPYEPSHLDLHCLQRYLFWSAGLCEFKQLAWWLANIVTIIQLVQSTD